MQDLTTWNQIAGEDNARPVCSFATRLAQISKNCACLQCTSVKRSLSATRHQQLSGAQASANVADSIVADAVAVVAWLSSSSLLLLSSHSYKTSFIRYHSTYRKTLLRHVRCMHYAALSCRWASDSGTNDGNIIDIPALSGLALSTLAIWDHVVKFCNVGSHDFCTPWSVTYLAEINHSFFIVIYDIRRKIWRHPFSSRTFNSQVKTTGSDLQWTGCTWTQVQSLTKSIQQDFSCTLTVVVVI